MGLKPQIVIAGAGFGGIYTLRYLGRYLNSNEARLTIIDQKNYFLFTPLLHEVATCSIGESQPTEEIKTLLRRRRADLAVATIQEINLAAREVRLAGGRIIPYDFLLLALGSSATDRGIKGAAQHGFFLKSLPDAVKLRRHLVATLSAAAGEKSLELRKELLCFVVVGGGPTGVELAGEIKELIRDVRRKHYPGVFEDREIKCALVQSGSELLPAFHPRLRAWARRSLTERGWEILTGKKVASVDASSVTLNDGVCLKSRTVILTAGVMPNTSVFSGFSPLVRGGRVLVDEYLRVPGQENVFALGDNATAVAEKDEWPMLAQAATQAAKIAARNISGIIHQKKLTPFYYRSAGALISLGRWQAVGEIGGYPIRGLWVWLLWQVVYLAKFISWSKRVKITGDWLWHVFRSRDITSSV